MHSTIFHPFWARVSAFRKGRNWTLHLLHFWQAFLPVSYRKRALSPFPLAFFCKQRGCRLFLGSGFCCFLVILLLVLAVGFFLRKFDSASFHYIGLFRNQRCRIASIRSSEEISTAEHYKIWTNLEQTQEQTFHTRSFLAQAETQKHVEGALRIIIFSLVPKPCQVPLWTSSMFFSA